MENVIIDRNSRYPVLVEGFVANFDTIWNTGRDEGVFENLIAEVEVADVIDLVFAPATLRWEEVTELRCLIRQRCPEVDSEPFRTKPEDHRTCDAR